MAQVCRDTWPWKDDTANPKGKLSSFKTNWWGAGELETGTQDAILERRKIPRREESFRIFSLEAVLLH